MAAPICAGAKAEATDGVGVALNKGAPVGAGVRVCVGDKGAVGITVHVLAAVGGGVAAFSAAAAWVACSATWARACKTAAPIRLGASIVSASGLSVGTGVAIAVAVGALI